MPQSRELANKKNDHKDRQSRGPMGVGTGPKKGGAGAHNWGVSTADEGAIAALDRNDPNYDSSEEN
ncbi:Programmed cell death PDCD4 [Phytophthora megakarya]|uniref:Programmed cell death PDCD4 n=1 Tax=Phytophthora megakarya TaxID=4795 RepID=A0A225VW23_9STRA|nr:Programmed cell death PDCD4 [Phytophthora megakarya]